MARISTIIYAELKGIRYLHTPLQSLDHTPAKVSPGDWAWRWENFLNYADQETASPGTILTPVSKAHRLRPLSGHIYAVKHCHKITNHLPLQWNALRARLRAGYHPSTAIVPTDGPVIAVHVRRGDVTNQGSNRLRYTPLESIVPRIELALQVLSKTHETPRVKIYSQGAPEEFAPLVTRFAAELCLGEDEFITFGALVSADALVMAKSSFSYLAALISVGVCIYEPFWHPPMPDWIEFPEHPL